jgi:hypothetical protein
VNNFYESCCRNLWKTFSIYKIRCNLTNTRFSGEYTRSESLTTKWTLMPSRIVWCERFFINWLKYCYFLLLSISHFVSSTSSIICQPWSKSWIECLSNILNDFFHLLIACYRSEDLNIGIHLVNIWSKSQSNNYNIALIRVEFEWYFMLPLFFVKRL